MKRATVLVRVPTWLGDAVLATAVVRSLAAARPAAPLVVLARAGVKDLFVGLSGVRYVLVEPEPERASAPACASLVRRLARERVGLAFVLTDSWLPVLLLRLARARRVYAVRGGAWRPFVRPVGRAPGHLLAQYAALLEAADAGEMRHAPQIEATPVDRDRAAGLLDAAGIAPGAPLTLVAPGVAYGPAKRWPAERMAAVARELERRGAVVALVGSPAERRLADRIAAEANVTSLVGRTGLRELIGLCAHADQVIGNDSGVVHLAAAVGTPTIGIYGSTDPRWTAPLSPSHVSIADPPACAPCFQRTCPIGTPCLTRVDVRRVVEIAAHRIGQRSGWMRAAR